MTAYDEVVRTLAVPLVSLIGGWLLKDVLLGIYRQRREEVKKEQQFRLREFYSPLFFWTGVAGFAGDRTSRGECIKRLGDLLQKAAPLVKHEHHFVFIRMYEVLCGQNVTPPTPERMQKARDWVYTQIELLNFALFTNSDDYDPREELNVLRPVKRAVRLGLSSLIQLVIWASFALLLYGLTLVTSGNYWALGFIVVLVALVLTAELKRRYALVGQIAKRMKV